MRVSMAVANLRCSRTALVLAPLAAGLSLWLSWFQKSLFQITTSQSESHQTLQLKLGMQMWGASIRYSKCYVAYWAVSFASLCSPVCV